MPPSNVVVDGSNIATEGRTTPSLDQLDQAVRQYLHEHPGANVTVVVDASFGHRIEPSERAAFEQAVAHGELVSPPAGAIGRGDAFLLRIAERIGARVLSNDSFREFHAEHPWLFDEDRLVGGTPVPGVGWIFTPRRPVRGPLTPPETGPPRRGSRDGARRSRPGDAEQLSERGGGAESADAVAASPGESEAGIGGAAKADDSKPKSGRSRGSRRRGTSDRKVQAAIAQATEEALTSGEGKKQPGKPKPKSDVAPDAVNDPLPFITFASEHPVGSELEGTVVSFTSHGAMAQVEDMLCYVPLAGLGDPPPRRARDVLHQGETRTFELVALDPARRGAQLALPEVVAVHGGIAEGAEEAASEVRRRRRRAPASSRSGARKPQASAPELPSEVKAEAAPPAVAEKRARRARGSLKSGAATEPTKPASRPRGAKSAAKTVEPVKKSPPKKVAAKKAAANKAPATKKAAQKQAPVKKVAATKKSAPAKAAAPAKKAAPTKKSGPAKKAAAAKASKSTKKAPSAKRAIPARKSADTQKASSAREAPLPTKSGAKKPPAPRKSAATKPIGSKAAKK
jgi:hypothetical protein